MATARTAASFAQILVVIAITTTLASFTLGATRSLEVGSRRAKTSTILATISKGMSLTVASRGALLSPSEHPLAGSRPGRADFLGVRDRHLDSDGVVRGGSVRALDTDHEALTGVEEWYLTSDRDRVLMADDRYADASAPHIYGLPRGELGVIGDPQQAVTRYRRLNRPPSTAQTLPGPYDATLYSDREHLVQPDGTREDGHTTFDYLFGNSNVQSELLAMGALSAPPNDLADHRIDPPNQLAGLDNQGRVWSAVGVDPADGASGWMPGLIHSGVIDLGNDQGSPDWKPYALRGLAVYDAWGHDILYSVTTTGAVVLQSAGQDGVFRFAPGGDRVYQTSADADEVAGDDRDCRTDNIRVEMVQ